MNPKPISFRLAEENLAKLNALAKRKEVSRNKMINFLISDYSASEETSARKDSSDETVLLKREFNLQRQRINVLQNQIDFLIGQKNYGKSGNRSGS